MKNVGDAVEAYLIRARIRIPEEASQSEVGEGNLPSQDDQTPPPKLSHRAELSRERLKKHQEICQQAKDLHAQGWSIHAKARAPGS